MDSSPSCDICGGPGWITRAGSLRAEPCVCQKDLKRKQRIAASRIPKRYLHCEPSGLHERIVYSLGAAKRRVAVFID